MQGLGSVRYMLAHENESQGFAQVLSGRDAPFISIDLEKLENKLLPYLGDSEKLSLYIRSSYL